MTATDLRHATPAEAWAALESGTELMITHATGTCSSPVSRWVPLCCE